MTIEGDRVAGFGRLEDGLKQASPWYTWGPYVSERQWGTVREDYSEDGDAWNYLPFDHARSRAYRWGEDGLAGFSDIHQNLCVGLALWNGRDAFLKERLFGLSGPEGNHGEDVKEHWWYTDAVPSHAWNTWRYHYPQAAFPYEQLRAENGRRDRRSAEYEILDTGVFEQDRYWVTEVTYVKSDDATELLIEIKVTNAGHETDTIHVLPTAWFRNTWSWDGSAKPSLKIAANGTGAADDSASGPRSRRSRSPPTERAPRTIQRAASTSGTRSSVRLSCSRPPRRTEPRPRRCSARTRPTTSGSSTPPRSPGTRRTASTTTSSAAPRP